MELWEGIAVVDRLRGGNEPGKKFPSHLVLAKSRAEVGLRSVPESKWETTAW